MLTYQQFIECLDNKTCPITLDEYQQALWYDYHNEWHQAHEIVQNINDNHAARIHAYLHRKEGDDWNSRYWHRHAGTTYPEEMSLGEEWEMLARLATHK